jgi:hypothetical protein
MADPAPARTTHLADAGQPLVLVGPPGRLQGQFQVRNAGNRKAVIRQPLLTGVTGSSTGRRRRGAAGAAAADAVALRRIIVRAGETRVVPLSIALSPTTAPGTYEGALDVDGDQRPVILHVTEHVAFSMFPDHLIVANRPGEKVKKTVVFTNDGNVPLPVRTIGTVVLDDELAHCRSLRGALADVGDTMEKLDDFLAALGRRYKQAYDTLALRVQNERVTLEPGETRAIDLTITLPEKLDPRARYSGYAAISTAALSFTVAPD